MSGDVQPRKRKDKKKKRESLDARKSEGELIFSRKSSLQDDEASHGVHITKMGSDDVMMHVHEEHGTGGHWCAKIIFFSLMAVLLGLVCLIILENRGISDVDTPLSESRFSNYFDGWVDEHRDDHDDHHDSHGSLEHDEDDHGDDEDDHDEPFEEEEDHSEGDDEEEDVEEDENVTPEEEEEDEDQDNATAENVTAEEDEDDEDVDDEEDNVTAEVDIDENATAEEDEDADDNDDDDNVTAENDNEEDNVTEEATIEQNDDDDEDVDDNDDNNTQEDDNVTKETSQPTSQDNQDDDNEPFDEDDDDGNLDSLENIVDNDAAELELLKEKARQQAAAESKQTAASAENDLEDEAENVPSWASSLAVKIGVGLALALVARLVLIRKNPNSTDGPAPEILMKRRLTIASPDEVIPEGVDEIMEPLPEDEEYSEEEIEIEEEIEYLENEPTAEENQVDAGDNDYVPETFEQLNAMYRPKDYKIESEPKLETKQPPLTETFSYQSPYTSNFNNNQNNNNNSKLANDEIKPSSTQSNQNIFKTTAPVFEAPPPPPLVEAKINVPPKVTPPKDNVPMKPETLKKEVTYDMDYEKEAAKPPTTEKETKKEFTHDMDYQPDVDDIDYDEDDIYDDDGEQDDDSEDLDDDDLLDDDDDLEDDEDVSDVDDTELMNRLEAKYGKLPAREYESDEDPDDPTWTQIKPKTGGGAQSLEDEELDLFEQELRRANEEMMREFNYH